MFSVSAWISITRFFSKLLSLPEEVVRLGLAGKKAMRSVSPYAANFEHIQKYPYGRR
jgi:hypothetical protein